MVPSDAEAQRLHQETLRRVNNHPRYHFEIKNGKLVKVKTNKKVLDNEIYQDISFTFMVDGKEVNPSGEVVTEILPDIRNSG